MSLTRRAFFGRVAAVAVGAVLAGKPEFKNRMWFTAKAKPAVFEHRFYGASFTVDPYMNPNQLMYLSRSITKEQFISEWNCDLLSGNGGVPKGVLSGS